MGYNQFGVLITRRACRPGAWECADYLLCLLEALNVITTENYDSCTRCSEINCFANDTVCPWRIGGARNAGT